MLTNKLPRNPTLTEKNGIYTLSAFAQELSSSDEEVSYSNYSRRLLKRRTQKVAEKAISDHTEYDSLFESGTIDNQTQLHCAVNEQVFIDNLTPDSKKIFFESYNSQGPSDTQESSPEYCPKRESSRRAKKIQNPKQLRAGKPNALTTSFRDVNMMGHVPSHPKNPIPTNSLRRPHRYEYVYKAKFML